MARTAASDDMNRLVARWRRLAQLGGVDGPGRAVLDNSLPQLRVRIADALGLPGDEVLLLASYMAWPDGQRYWGVFRAWLTTSGAVRIISVPLTNEERLESSRARALMNDYATTLTGHRR